MFLLNPKKQKQEWPPMNADNPILSYPRSSALIGGS
jgi:hypothetical protein